MNISKPRATSRRTAALRAVLLLTVAVTSGLPLLLLVARSLSVRWYFPALLPDDWTTSGWRPSATGGALSRSVATSVELGVMTAVVSCAIALPLGRTLARLRGWSRHLAGAAAFLPVAAPPLALGTGLQVVVLGLGLGGTFAGVLFAHLVPAVGYLTLVFLGTFTLFDARVEEASRTLGATRFATLRRVTLPLLRPQIAEALVIGFLISWSQFALTLVIGGGEVRALPLEVFTYLRAGQDQPAAVGALLLVLPAAAAFVALRWAAQRTVAVVT